MISVTMDTIIMIMDGTTKSRIRFYFTRDDCFIVIGAFKILYS